jgi:hypothetical protein
MGFYAAAHKQRRSLRRFFSQLTFCLQCNFAAPDQQQPDYDAGLKLISSIVQGALAVHTPITCTAAAAQAAATAVSRCISSTTLDYSSLHRTTN